MDIIDELFRRSIAYHFLIDVTDKFFCW